MKKLFAFLCLVLSIVIVNAQEISQKYGRITIDELEMTSYANDTSADAVILYEDGYSKYEYVTTGFQATIDIKRKIKILTQEGVDEGNISITFYYRSQTDRDQIIGLEAFAYNLVGGKIEKTKLEKKYIFEEVINDSYKRIKFSIPSVKQGTVIEYKYRRICASFELPDWNMQGRIPTLNSRLDVVIPEYFVYGISTKGYEPIDVKEDKIRTSFNLGTQSGGRAAIVSCNSRNIIYTGKDLPALKDEAYVWCVNDYTTGVRFELNATNFPYDFYRPFTTTWEAIDDFLNTKSDFGSNLKMSSPFKSEVDAIIAASQSEDETIANIYAFIMRRMKWTGAYTFSGNGAREAAKNGVGNNAQINMVLISALKQAKINSFPILVNTRSAGRIPLSHPSLNQLNTFVVGVRSASGALVVMDGSARYGGVNMLPDELLVDRARVFTPDTPGDKWVDLTTLSKNRLVYLFKISIDSNGLMTGEREGVYTAQDAYNFKVKFGESKKDSLAYIEGLQQRYQVKIDEITFDNRTPLSNSVTEKIKFSKQLEAVGDLLMLNPMIFPHIESNPFTQSERKLPIEFNYPSTYMANIIIQLPENYSIDAQPESMQFSLKDKDGRCIYHLQAGENNIRLSYQFMLNRTIFPQTDYDFLRDYYGHIATKNGEMIVLKKR